nr:reverse transcriptase domain-containing protein [Tanacetum cinerariifolium]
MFSLVYIMPSRMRTRSVGQHVAESRGERTGERAGRGGRGRGPKGGNDERVDELNDQKNDQGLGANGNVEGVNRNVEGVNRGVGGAPDFSTIIAQQLQMLLPAILAQVGNQGNVRNQNEEFCPSHEMKKLETELWNHAMVGAGHVAYTDRFQELARLVLHLVTPEIRKIERYVYGLAPQIRRMVAAMEPKTMQKVNDKYKIGEGYHAVPPPYTGNFMPPKPNLILADVDEYVLSESITSVPVVATSEVQNIKELVSDDKLEKKTIFLNVAKIEFVRLKQQEKPVRKPVKYAEMYKSLCPRGNQRNWNNQKSQQLGSDFVTYNKGCFVCGHPQKEDQGYVDSGCSWHITENMSYLSDFKEFDRGYVTFGGGAKGGKITGKGTLKTSTEERIGASHASKETGSSKDYILMPLWKDGSLFDSSSKNASNDEPQPYSDAGKKDDEGVSKES